MNTIIFNGWKNDFDWRIRFKKATSLQTWWVSKQWRLKTIDWSHEVQYRSQNLPQCFRDISKSDGPQGCLDWPELRPVVYRFYLLAVDSNPFIHIFIHPLIHSSIHYLFIHSYIHTSVRPSIHPSVHLAGHRPWQSLHSGWDRNICKDPSSVRKMSASVPENRSTTVDEWMDGWMDEWMDEWMDGWKMNDINLFLRVFHSLFNRTHVQWNMCISHYYV